jgi:hypothetical protein
MTEDAEELNNDDDAEEGARYGAVAGRWLKKAKVSGDGQMSSDRAVDQKQQPKTGRKGNKNK